MTFGAISETKKLQHDVDGNGISCVVMCLGVHGHGLFDKYRKGQVKRWMGVGTGGMERWVDGLLAD